MLTRQQKQKAIDEIIDKLKKAKSTVFVDYKGLKVSELSDLRKKLKADQAELKVAKKTFIDIALQAADIKDGGAKSMDGQIALAFGDKDEVAAAKTIGLFSKKNDKLKILGAILEGRFLDQSQAVALSKVPPREQSLAGLVGTLNAPLSNLVGVLQGNLRSLVFVLSQIDASRHPERA